MILVFYLLRFQIGPFFFGTSVVMFVFILQFVLNHIDKLVGKGLDAWIIAQVVGLNLAWMMVLAVPMGVLFMTLMSFGGMSAAQEITIMRASGMSLLRMMRPAIIAGLLLTCGVYWFNDEVLPDANHRAKTLMQDIQRKKPTFAIEGGQFASQIEGYTILSRQTKPDGTLLGVTIYDQTSPLRASVVSADTGRVAFNRNFTRLIITLNRGEIHQIGRQNPADYRRILFSTHRIALETNDFAFTRSSDDMFSRGDREMNIAAMKELVRKSETSILGIDSSANREIEAHLSYIFNGEQIGVQPPKLTDDNAWSRVQSRISIIRSALESTSFQREDNQSRIRGLSVEIYKKYAIPFACFVFVFVGCPLGVMSRRGNFGISAAISLGIYIVYWACLIAGEKLADRAVISPAAGMWMGNVVIGFIGLFITMQINTETLPFFNKIKRITTGFFVRKKEQ
ncbi:MAG: LptF/LptG family permease [Bacteroidetes bacterium]|nr:LptF/LptG family permease [Bacteroidota bacterium]